MYLEGQSTTTSFQVTIIDFTISIEVFAFSTAHKLSWGKVIISQVSVCSQEGLCPSTEGISVQGGVSAQGGLSREGGSQRTLVTVKERAVRILLECNLV